MHYYFDFSILEIDEYFKNSQALYIIIFIGRYSLPLLISESKVKNIKKDFNLFGIGNALVKN